jgi:hypothetical protein
MASGGCDFEERFERLQQKAVAGMRSKAKGPGAGGMRKFGDAKGVKPGKAATSKPKGSKGSHVMDSDGGGESKGVDGAAMAAGVESPDSPGGAGGAGGGLTEGQMAAARARLDAKANRTMRSGGKKEKKKGPGSPTKKVMGKGKPTRLGAAKLSKAELSALDRTKEVR